MVLISKSSHQQFIAIITDFFKSTKCTAECKQFFIIYWDNLALFMVNHMFQDLMNNSTKFYNFFRMSLDSFLNLKNLLHDTILMQNTNYRRAIQPAERLLVFFEVSVIYKIMS